MRLSEIGYKEIVDLSTGTNHGRLSDAEMAFDRKTGKIKSVLAPSIHSTGLFRKGFDDMYELPWETILIIGEDLIIFQSRPASCL